LYNLELKTNPPGAKKRNECELSEVMNVEAWIWIVSIAAIAVVIIGDLIVQVRKPHEPTFKESAIQYVVYFGLALMFTLLVTEVWGARFGGEYLAGYITEWSLSVDNLFVFLIIFTKFKVPRHLQSEALLVGIVLALILRGIFIALGAAAIENFSWVFYLFGAFLLYTAVLLVWDTFKEEEEDKVPGGKIVALIKTRFRTVDEYHGTKLTIMQKGKRYITPLLLVMIAIGFTDLLFALDSIPAVYGLTSEPYIVFMANAFALLGLRQLFFLLSGLMERLKYLGVGLAIILGWIGVKLVIHALHKNELAFINGGEPIKVVPEISTELSLGVIISTLIITTIVSLIATSKDKKQTPKAKPAKKAASKKKTGSKKS
jgi:tellurite resistance protein TerC